MEQCVTHTYNYMWLILHYSPVTDEYLHGSTPILHIFSLLPKNTETYQNNAMTPLLEEPSFKHRLNLLNAKHFTDDDLHEFLEILQRCVDENLIFIFNPKQIKLKIWCFKCSQSNDLCSLPFIVWLLFKEKSSVFKQAPAVSII